MTYTALYGNIYIPHINIYGATNKLLAKTGKNKPSCFYFFIFSLPRVAVHLQATLQPSSCHAGTY